MTVSRNFYNSNGLVNLKSRVSKGNNLFKDISKISNTVSNSPITRFVGENAPVLRPVLNNIKKGNEKIQNIGNQLERAERKVQDIEKAINFR